MQTSIPLTPPVIAPGRVVRLDDGRIGLVEFAWEHPYCTGEARCFVVGVEREFADWVTREQIVRVYGVVTSASVMPAPIA
jgi:hypothetical protein